MGQREIFSAAAIVITVGAYFPYVRGIWRGETRPHVFSWIVWAVATLVVCAAQLKDRGGAGAWPIGVSGVITAYVAGLAFAKRGDMSVNWIDWAFLTVSLGALPLWYVTTDPFWAVLVLTAVDVLGFGPTLRKAWNRPHEEQVMFFGWFALRNAVSIPALENLSATTLLFPVATGVACVLVMAVIGWRRKVVEAEEGEY